jgi:hypothetical protein
MARENDWRGRVARHGWTVDDRFIFADDGVSGDRFPASTGTPAHDRSIWLRSSMSSSCKRPTDSRVGAGSAMSELQQLAQHVESWFYADNQRFEHGTFES